MPEPWTGVGCSVGLFQAYNFIALLEESLGES